MMLQVSTRLAAVGSVVSVAILAVLPYLDILEFTFNNSDALTLIDTSRVASVSDLTRVLTEPLMNGSSFIEEHRYYRPVSSLSYSVDHALWSLSPRGYHATNLGLHALVVVLAMLFVQRLEGGRLSGWLAACVFAVHPVLIETIPSLARRHDILATLFTLLALTLVVGRRGEDRRFRALSLVAAAFALGSKETAVIVPAAVFAVRLASEEGVLSLRVKRGLREATPYLILTAAFVAWRGLVLGELVGGSKSGALPASIIIRRFTLALADSQALLRPFVAIVVLSLASVTALALLRSAQDRTRAAAAFLAFFTLLPLAVYVPSHSFALRGLYLPAIGWCGLWAVVTLHCIREVRRRLDAGGLYTRDRAFGLVAAVWSLLALGYLASLIATSPLVQTYPEWRLSNTVLTILHHRLGQAVAGVPENATIRLRDVPGKYRSDEPGLVHAHSVSGGRRWTFESWLRLFHPERRLAVEILSHREIGQLPADIRVETHCVDRDCELAIQYLPAPD
jgi:hypothetical protein